MTIIDDEADKATPRSANVPMSNRFRPSCKRSAYYKKVAGGFYLRVSSLGALCKLYNVKNDIQRRFQ